MPAQRSRTTGWRCCLQQLLDRKGSLQIALTPKGSSGRDFVWRAKLIALTEDEIHIEMPTTAGEPLPLEKGVHLLGIMAVGQNRWMFRTDCVGTFHHNARGRETLALRLQLPDAVERCQRRRNLRISTDKLLLPEATVWPLLDLKSVALPEHLCQLRFNKFQEGITQSLESLDEGSIPDVGPPFTASVVNIGGGGLGLQVDGSALSSIPHHRMLWLRFPLVNSEGPQLCLSAKLVHQRLEAGGSMYLGMRFDFTFNPAHRHFVIKQITRCVALQQRDQLLAA